MFWFWSLISQVLQWTQICELMTNLAPSPADSILSATMGDDPVQRYTVALKIAIELKNTGRLQPVDEWMVTKLQKLLEEAKS